MTPADEIQPYPSHAAADAAAATEDPLFGCWFCGAPSVAIAARYSGGDEDVPAHWLPVCATHLENWHADVPDEDSLPVIPREAVALTGQQARVILAAILEDGGYLRECVNQEVDGLDDAITALQSALRFINPEADSTPGAPGNDERRYDELES